MPAQSPTRRISVAGSLFAVTALASVGAVGYTVAQHDSATTAAVSGTSSSSGSSSSSSSASNTSSGSSSSSSGQVASTSQPAVASSNAS